MRGQKAPTKSTDNLGIGEEKGKAVGKKGKGGKGKEGDLDLEIVIEDLKNE